MTEEQAEQVIELLEFQNEFITGFMGAFSVEAFNVLSFLGIITCGLLLAIFVITSISDRKDT